VHEKYTYKDGKKYGPYKYETKRVDGRVVTTYLGNDVTSKVSRYLLVIGVAVVISFFMYTLYLKSPSLSSSLTGKISLDVKFVYQLGEPVDGLMKFRIKEGELIPSDSMVEIMYADQSKTVPLSSLVNDATISGDYYAEDSELSGSGEGYGVIGTKITYPEITFKVSVYDNGQSISTPDSSGSTSSGSSESNDEPVASDVSTSDSGSASDSSSGSESTDAGITGNALAENEFTVDGVASYDSPFTYNVAADQSAHIVPGSVMVDGKVLPDQTVSLTTENGKLIASTGYFVNERGFGRNYLGDYALSLDVDVLKLGLNAIPGNIEVRLVSQGKTLASQKQEVTVLSSPLLVNDSGTENNANLTLLADIPTVRIADGESVTIDLADYFSGADSYGVSISNVTASFDGSLLTLTPDAHFKGIRQVTIIAHSGDATLESNEFKLLIAGLNVVTSRDKIEVGKNVKWTKQVSLDEIGSANVQLPANAENISIITIGEDGNQTIEPTISAVSGSSISGNVVIDLDLRKEPVVFRWWRSFVHALTGRAVDTSNEGDDSQKLDVSLEGGKKYIVEYYTGAPVALEQDTTRGKVVTISGPSEVEYTDVVASTSLSNSLHAQESQIRVYWTSASGDVAIKNVSAVPETSTVEDTESESGIISSTTGSVIAEDSVAPEKVSLPFDAYDSDDDGNIDYIEWIVPHLSNQTFEIITVTKADHLNESRAFVSDIYDQVKALDDVWSETIPNGHFVRVTFEKNLTNANDITLYPRVVNGTPQILVHQRDSNASLARFDTIIDNRYSSIYLTELSGTQDVFDLEVLNGSVQFDHIVDPTGFNATELNVQRGVLDSWGGTSTDVPVSIPFGTTSAFILSSVRSASNQPSSNLIAVNYTNSSALHFDRYGSATASVEWQVVDGGSKFQVQNGFVSNSTASIAPISLLIGLPTAVNTTSSFALVRGEVNSATSSQAIRGTWTIEFFNSTTINVTRATNGTPSAFYWQVIQINDSQVQSGVTNLGSANTASATLSSVVNKSQSFLVLSTRTTSTLFAGAMVAGTLVNGSLVRFDRNSTAATGTVVSWFVVSNPSFTVQSGSVFLNASGDLGENVTISSVNMSQSFIISSLQNNDSITGSSLGRVLATEQLATPTIAQFLKGASTAWSNVSWQVVSLVPTTVDTFPLASFVSPTPAANSNIDGSAIYVNVSSSDERQHFAFTDFNRDLLLWLRMDTTNSSGDVVDESSYGFNASKSTTTTMGTGFYGQGAVFDGAGSLTMPSNKAWNLTNNNLTFSLWMNNALFSAGGNGLIASRSVCILPFWALAFAPAESRLKINIANETSTNEAYLTSSLATNTFYHLAVTISSNGTAMNATAYINGQVNGSVVLTLVGNLYGDTPPVIGSFGCRGAMNGTLDEVLVFNRTLDSSEIGSLYNAATSPYSHNFTGLTSGNSYNFTAYALDTTGNKNTTETRKVTLNSQGGSVTVNVTAPLNITYTSVQTVLNNTVTGSVQACWYSTDLGVTNTTITCGANVTGLNSGQGSSTWKVYINNSAGTQNSSSVTFFVDSIAPNVQFNSPSESDGSSYTRTNIQINITASDTNLANLTINLYNASGLVNSTLSANGYNFVNISSLAPAIYYFNATAVDILGNSNSTATRNVTITVPVPTLSIAYPTNTNYTAVVTVLNYSVFNSPQACWYSNNLGVTNTTVVCGTNVTGLNSGQGSSTWKVYANNSAGIINSSSVTFYVDSLLPLVSYGTGTPADSSYAAASSIYVNVSITETNFANVTYRLYNQTDFSGAITLVNMSTFNTPVSAINWTGLSNDKYFYNVTVVDTLSNSNSTVTRTIVLDTRAPTVTISSPLNRTYTNANLSISFAPEDDADFPPTAPAQSQWFFNGSANETYSASVTRNFSQGSNFIIAYVNDSAGNVGNATVYFSVDSIIPTLQFVSPTETNASTLARANLQINVTASDSNFANITVNVYNTTGLVNSSFSTASTYFVNVTSLSDGAYRFNATVLDTFGNSNSTETRVVTITTQVPSVTIAYPANTSYSALVTALNYSVSSSVQACWYSTNLGVTNTTVTCGTNVTGLTSSQGSNTWKVFANNSAGTQNSSSVTFIVDTLVPLISYTLGTENPGEISSGSIYVNVSINESSTANVTFTLYNSSAVVNTTVFTGLMNAINFTNLADGVYLYQANITDVVGNRNATTLASISLISSCLGSICTEGSSCTINSTCLLHSGLCTDGVCDFVNFSIQNTTVYTLYDGNRNGQNLILNLTSNSSQASLFSNISQFIFGGKNGTVYGSGSGGGNAGSINITAQGLFNRSQLRFIGLGGKTTTSGAGGNGGIVQFNYHGLIRNATVLLLAPGNSSSGTFGVNGTSLLLKDSACPGDEDVTDPAGTNSSLGLVNVQDILFIISRYGNVSSDSTYHSNADVNCDNIINVIDLARVGRMINNR
jgi:hypothetical protein